MGLCISKMEVSLLVFSKTGELMVQATLYFRMVLITMEKLLQGRQMISTDNLIRSNFLTKEDLGKICLMVKQKKKEEAISLKELMFLIKKSREY